MGIFNQYSFVWAAAVFGVLLAAGAWFGLRALRLKTRLRLTLVSVVMLVFIVASITFNLSRHYPDATVRTAADVESTLANGQPTLVMLYSNY
ncbi:MAG: hypothetical protein U0694_02385 [Anaerolineae bacterium]